MPFHDIKTRENFYCLYHDLFKKRALDGGLFSILFVITRTF